MSYSTVSPKAVQDVSQTAVYLRVSTSQQTTRSQNPDLQRWLSAQEPEKLGIQLLYIHLLLQLSLHTCDLRFTNPTVIQAKPLGCIRPNFHFFRLP